MGIEVRQYQIFLPFFLKCHVLIGRPHRILSALQCFLFCFILTYVVGRIMLTKVMLILSSATMSIFDNTTNKIPDYVNVVDSLTLKQDYYSFYF